MRFYMMRISGCPQGSAFNEPLHRAKHSTTAGRAIDLVLREIEDAEKFLKRGGKITITIERQKEARNGN